MLENSWSLNIKIIEVQGHSERSEFWGGGVCIVKNYDSIIQIC